MFKLATSTDIVHVPHKASGDARNSVLAGTVQMMFDAVTTMTELAKAGQPFTKENLERTYVARRRASWVEEEGLVAEKARDGFHRGVVTGLLGMAIAGFSKGKYWIDAEPQLMPDLPEYYKFRISAEELKQNRHPAIVRYALKHTTGIRENSVHQPHLAADGQAGRQP